MLNFSKTKVLSIYLFFLLISIFVFSNFYNLDRYLFSKKVNLGLDLQGGSYLLLEVDSSSLEKRRLQSKVVPLKKKLNDGNKKFEKEGSSLKKEEQDLIAKKKLVSPEEYKNNINDLRKKNIDYQKRRQKAANDIFRQKEKAITELYKALNPILQKYMSENNIKMIIKKNSIVVATTEIDLTDKILKVLDQQLKSINLN